MFKVVIYFDDETYQDFDFEHYCLANAFLQDYLRKSDHVLIAKILKGEDTIKVVSNIGFYDEANRIMYGYWR